MPRPHPNRPRARPVRRGRWPARRGESTSLAASPRTGHDRVGVGQGSRPPRDASHPSPTEALGVSRHAEGASEGRRDAGAGAVKRLQRILEQDEEVCFTAIDAPDRHPTALRGVRTKRGSMLPLISRGASAISTVVRVVARRMPALAPWDLVVRPCHLPAPRLEDIWHLAARLALLRDRREQVRLSRETTDHPPTIPQQRRSTPMTEMAFARMSSSSNQITSLELGLSWSGVPPGADDDKATERDQESA